MCPDRSRESRLRIMLESLDTLSSVLVSPVKAFEDVRSQRPFLLALLAALSMAIVSGLVIAPNPPELARVIFDLEKGSLGLWQVLPVWVCFFIVVVWFQATFVHITAIILKGRGPYTGILCGLCLAYLPGLLAAPLAVLRAVLSSQAANAVYQILFPLLCLWVFVLAIIAVQTNYRITKYRALCVCSIAFGALVISPMVIAVVLMTRAMT